MVSLDCRLWVFLMMCQAASVRPHGITLPITSLSYKSSPANPKCLSSITDNSEISPPINNGITSGSTSLGIKPIPQESPSKLVTPAAATNLPLKAVSVSSLLPQSNVINTNLQVRDIPVEINNFKPSTASSTQVLLPSNLNNVKNNLTNDDILKDYLPKAPPIVLTPNNIINNKDINAINLKSSPPIMVKAVPYDTYKISNGNIQPIYIDCSKQNCIPPSTASVNPEIIKVKDLRLIHERQVAQNVAAIENIFRETKEVLVPNVPSTPDNTLKTTNSQDRINCPQQSTDGMRYVNIETPVVINNVIFPNTNQMLNYKTLDKNIQLKPNPDYVKTELDLLVTPKVNIGNNKVAAIPSIPSEYENINNVIYNEPALETFSYSQPQVPFSTQSYVNDKVPVLSQLPNVCNSKVTALFESPKCTIPILSVTESPRENTLLVPNVSPNSLENYLGPFISIADPSYSNIAQLNVPRSLTSTSSIPNSQSYNIQVPILPQLPNVNKISEVIFSPPALPPPSLPPNIIFMKTPDLSYPNLLDNKIPALAFNSELNRICPNELQYNLKMLPNNLNSFNYPILNIDTNIMPIINSNSISSNILSSTLVPSIPSTELPIYFQPSEYIIPKMTSPSAPNILYPNQKSISIPDPHTSTLSDSLNSLVSTLTSSLLSAFYDISAKSEKEVVFDVPTLPETVTDLPSSIFSESSFSFSMPLYILSPPPLESPASLPTPKVKLPCKRVEKVSSSVKRKSGLKPPKTYISSILINISPPKEVSNDIVIIV